MKKTAKKKVVKIREGITSKRTSTGINVTISTNGRVLCTMRGYNNNQNVQKGLTALHQVMINAWADVGKYDMTDLTLAKPKKKAKKAAKKSGAFQLR